MTEQRHRPPLTNDELSEKKRIHDAYKAAKSVWADRNEKLTDQKLGELVADVIDRESPYSQGAVWQFTSLKSGTRPPDEFIIGFAIVLDEPLELLCPRLIEDARKFEQLLSTTNYAGVRENKTPYEGTAIALPGDDALMRQKPEIMLRRVPVLTEQDIVSRQGVKQVTFHAETVATDIDVTAKAFGWKVNTSELGDLNTPFSIPVVATLIVEPEIKPKHGDWLLISDENENISVRRLDIDGSHMYLHSLKAKHDPFLLDESYIIHGVVVSISLKTR